MEITTITHDVMPYATSAIGAYGSAVLAKTTDLGANEIVGTRILQRIFGRGVAAASGAIERVAKEPDDARARADLHRLIRAALEEDPTLAGEVAQLLLIGRLARDDNFTTRVPG